MSAQPQTVWQLEPMTAAQLQPVLEIERRAYEFPWSEGVFRDCLNAGYSAWQVRSAAGPLLAYAVMSMAVGEAHVLNVCTEPALRRQGLARFLVEHLKRIARGAQCEVMMLEVRPSNTAGLALYRALGFREVGRRKDYYPARQGREDALLLNCELK